MGNSFGLDGRGSRLFQLLLAMCVIALVAELALVARGETLAHDRLVFVWIRRCEFLSTGIFVSLSFLLVAASLFW